MLSLPYSRLGLLPRPRLREHHGEHFDSSVCDGARVWTVPGALVNGAHSVCYGGDTRQTDHGPRKRRFTDLVRGTSIPARAPRPNYVFLFPMVSNQRNIAAEGALSANPSGSCTAIQLGRRHKHLVRGYSLFLPASAEVSVNADQT